MNQKHFKTLLWLNAALFGIVGIDLVIFAADIAQSIVLVEPLYLIIAGLLSLVLAIDYSWVATRNSISKRTAKAVVVVNAMIVMGDLILIQSFGDVLTSLGLIAVSIEITALAVLAALQYRCLAKPWQQSLAAN